MNVFISGGCKNGKSHYAQDLAGSMASDAGRPLYYVATMVPRDEEDAARIKRHVADRDGKGFITLEKPDSLAELLEDDGVDADGVFLVDSVTALLSNEMFDDAGNMDDEAGPRVKKDLVKFAGETGNTLFVSDDLYGDAMFYAETTEAYMKSLAGIDRALADCCQRVVEISSGIPEVWK